MDSNPRSPCGGAWACFRGAPVQQMGVVLARNSPIRVSLPRFHFRVGLHIVLFEIPWRVGGSDRFPGKVKGLLPPILELTMNITTDQPEAPTAIRTDLGAIFVSLELSRCHRAVERRCRSIQCVAAM